MSEGKKKTHTSELYRWDGKPTIGQTAPLALQHVVAAVVGIVTPAILVANSANNAYLGAGGDPSALPVNLGLLIQVSLVFAALSTLLQLFGGKIHLGSSLPVIIGVSFAYVPTMQAIVTASNGSSDNPMGIRTIMGGMLVGGVVAILVGIFIRQIRKVFPPLVIGTVIFAIGLSLYKTAVNYMAGNSANLNPANPVLRFGSWQNWLVAVVTLVIVTALNYYGKGILKLASILIGLICGYLLAMCLGMVDFSAVGNAAWIQIPMPFAFGTPVFDISACLPLAILFLVNSIQAIGDFSATTSGGMDRLPTNEELNGGIIGYGVSNIFSSLFGCLPTATFSQNVGIVGSTKVVARRIFATSAGILLVAGLMPKFAGILRTIPQCVLGGAVVSVFASIAMTGIKLLVSEGMTTRNMTVAGLSIAIGMGVSLTSATTLVDGKILTVSCLDSLSATLFHVLGMGGQLVDFQRIINNTFASSPVVLATILAVILNLVLPKDNKEK